MLSLSMNMSSIGIFLLASYIKRWFYERFFVIIVLTFAHNFFTICGISIDCGRLAQLVEHQSYKLGVVGSNPTPPTR